MSKFKKIIFSSLFFCLPFLVLADDTVTAKILSNTKIETSNQMVGVVVSGDYAYTADSSNGLNIFNVADPMDPELMSNYDTSDNDVIVDLAITGNYVYLAGYDLYAEVFKPLIIVDVSDPSTPTLAGYYTSDNLYDSHALAVSGNYVYLAGSVNGDEQIAVVDVSDPASSELVSSYAISSGTVVDMYISGNYLYYVDSDHLLNIIDISDPATLSLAASYDTGYVCNSVQVSGNYVYAGGANLEILDISDLSNIQLLSSTSLNPSAAYLSGNYLYSVNAYYGLTIVDVSDPSSPEIIITDDLDDRFVTSVFVVGDYVYTGSYLEGLTIVDVSDKETPTILSDAGNLSGNVLDIKNIDTYSYVLDQSGLYILDVVDPTAPELVGSYRVIMANFQGMDVVGNYAYLGYSIDPGSVSKIDIVDISDPTAPELVGSYYNSEESGPGAYITALKVNGNYIYQAYRSTVDSVTVYAMAIIDISDPTAPELVGTYDVSEDIDGLFVTDDYVYLTQQSDTENFTILDVSDPTSITRVGGIFTSASSGQQVVVQDSYAYVLNYGHLTILDISDPAAPVQVGSYSDFNDSLTYDIYVLGQFAYIAADDEVVILDISDPTSPQYYTSITDDFDDASVVSLDEDGTIYVGSNSLYVLRVDFDGDGVYDTTEIIDVEQVEESEVSSIQSTKSTNNKGIVATRFANNKSIYTTIFKTKNKGDLKLKNYETKIYLALRSDGKKLASFNAKTGKVISKINLFKKYHYKNSSLKLFTLDNKDFVGITQKRKNRKSVYSLIRIKNNNKLKLKDKVRLKKKTIKITKTSKNKRKINFKNKSGKILLQYKITKKLKLIKQ